MQQRVQGISAAQPAEIEITIGGAVAAGATDEVDNALRTPGLHVPEERETKTRRVLQYLAGRTGRCRTVHPSWAQAPAGP